MEALANLIMAPFRLLYSMFQTIVIVLTVLILLAVTPFISFFTMSSYQEQANNIVTSRGNRGYLVMDFSTNTAMGISEEGRPAYVTAIREDSSYNSLMGRDEYGIAPADWAFHNVVGFYGNSEEWIRGKEAPMYAAYAEASITSDNLHKELTQCLNTTKFYHGHPICYPYLSTSSSMSHIKLPDAPKIGMAYADNPNGIILTLPFVLFGICPQEDCHKEDLRFHEAHELFTPSLSDGQAKAIAQMQYMMSDDFWLKEAHANGIYYEDAQLLGAAAANRDALELKYAPHQNSTVVFLEFGFLLLVVTLIGRFTYKAIRFIFY